MCPKITILEETTKNPISLIGKVSGICYGSKDDDEHNYKRGIENIESNHGRTLEFPQIYLKIEGYSARVIRELYTHIGGSPSRLQASTRYIDYDNFSYMTPSSIFLFEDRDKIYTDCMDSIVTAYKKLLGCGVSKEDAANLLPLGMTSTMVLRTNLRNLVDMSHQRLCSRAYWEFQNLVYNIAKTLADYSEEWKTLIADMNIFVPKCEVLGYCPEKKGCGKYKGNNKK